MIRKFTGQYCVGEYTDDNFIFGCKIIVVTKGIAYVCLLLHYCVIFDLLIEQSSRLA